MRIARVAIDGETYLCRIDEAATVQPLLIGGREPGRDPLREALAAGIDLVTAAVVATPVALDPASLLSPVAAPQKVLAVGLNYADHARETGQQPPASPVVFAKTPNSITGPGAPIRYSLATSERVDYEAELAVVIGRRARDVDVGSALDHVFGYTACNDVSARDAQFGDGQWMRGKSFDTFCPLGPWIVTADDVGDPQSLAIACRVNGATLQDGTTSEMIFGVAEIVSFLSRCHDARARRRHRHRDAERRRVRPHPARLPSSRRPRRSRDRADRGPVQPRRGQCLTFAGASKLRTRPAKADRHTASSSPSGSIRIAAPRSSKLPSPSHSTEPSRR